MTNQDRIDKYIKEYCNNCKNKNKGWCEIRTFVIDKTIITKCYAYEREKNEN